MALKLNDLVHSKLGVPISEIGADGIEKYEFCTLKEYIDNPETLENFRLSIKCGVGYDNEVFEYLDTLHFPKIEQIIRKQNRDGKISLN